MKEVLFDALKDTALILPWLLIIYIIIEVVENKFGSQIRERIKSTGKAGPAFGAAFGCVPQCGFSVISTALYSKRLITIGTLLAVYLSTSDEAIPIILAHPQKAGAILPLLGSKIGLAIVAGFTIDLFSRLFGDTLVKSETCAASENNKEIEISAVGGENNEKGCCGHSVASKKVNFKGAILHPLIHTLKVLSFIFLITFIINLIIWRVGEENLNAFLMGHTLLQPIVAGLIGLIPNCAASVAVTQMFLMGGIGFGATVAGLSSGAGLGILVLFKENNNLKDSLKIIGMLYSISVIAGIVIQVFYY